MDFIHTPKGDALRIDERWPVGGHALVLQRRIRVQGPLIRLAGRMLAQPGEPVRPLGLDVASRVPVPAVLRGRLAHQSARENPHDQRPDRRQTGCDDDDAAF